MWQLCITLYFLSCAQAVFRPTGDNHGSSNQCPFGCYCMGESITCPNWSTNEIPLPLPTTTIVLSLPNFHKYSINSTFFIKTPNLEWLQLNQGNLNEFPGLPYLPRLSFLDISENNIYNLPPYAFRNTQHLTHLNISSNNISIVSLNFLNGLTNLRVLDMSDNPSLPLLESQFFESGSSLNYLDLSKSNVDTKDMSWANTLHHLYFLNLSHNSIMYPLANVNNPVIGVLDMSYNPIKEFPALKHIPNINELYAHHANISEIKYNDLDKCKNLKILDLSYNNIVKIKEGVFRNCKQLQILRLSGNFHLKIIEHRGLLGLHFLQYLYLSETPILSEIDNSTFVYTPQMKEIHLDNSGLSVLPYSLKTLTNLTALSMKNNTLICSCYIYWLPQWLFTSKYIIWQEEEYFPCQDKPRSLPELALHIKNLKCERTKISPPKNKWVLAPWEESATLDCNVTGNPQPKIIWQTANHQYLLYNKSDIGPWVNKKIAYALTVSEDNTFGKYQVLPSGQIIIRNVSRNDIGRYKCFAFNSMSNASITMFLGIQDTAFRAFVMESQSFGLACAALFLFITLLVQLIRGIMDRFGVECCCCKNRLRSRANHLKQLLESVEFYKSAQLDRLRENYNSQVISIKDSCYQQMERVRESYAHQSKNLRDLCDYSTQQLTGARDQYVDQVNRIRDYSLGQMNRVRENYVFQRQRIRKFSANQLFRLRETYKYQQKTFNKLMETLPDLYIQNCRTGSCQRTDSIIFDDEIDGLDIYYKVDFLDSQSSNSDYFTPSSTLPRQKNKHIFKNQADYFDYERATEEGKSLPHNRFHSRSFSLVNTISGNRISEIIKGHKRSSSVTQSPNPSKSSSQFYIENDDLSDHVLSTQVYNTPTASPRSTTPINMQLSQSNNTNITEEFIIPSITVNDTVSDSTVLNEGDSQSIHIEIDTMDENNPVKLSFETSL